MKGPLPVAVFAIGVHDPSLRDPTVGGGADSAAHIAKVPMIAGIREANGVGTFRVIFEPLNEELFVTHS